MNLYDYMGMALLIPITGLGLAIGIDVLREQVKSLPQNEPENHGVPVEIVHD